MRPVFILICLLLPASALAETASRQQLDQLRAEISKLEQRVTKDLSERDAAQLALRKIERKIGNLSHEARELEREQTRAATKLTGLRDQHVAMAKERTRQIEWLARTARASYMSGRQETLKLLLNQEQPDSVARLLKYQDYFQTARAERVSTLGAELKSLLAMAERVEHARDELIARQQALGAQQQRLNDARTQRAEALAGLTRSLSTNQQRLDSMRGDEKRLGALLREMQTTLNDIPANPSGAPFGKLANKLPWPVKRDLSARFGTTREGPVRWNGVLLNARAGTPVRVIHSGRVVYADWLRGYGLLTIIDHGGGYLTLYGYNQSLVREVGEWVSTGDVIAFAGDSGGRDRAGLYFEIRRDGAPVNPDRWCNSRVTLPPVAIK